MSEEASRAHLRNSPRGGPKTAMGLTRCRQFHSDGVRAVRMDDGETRMEIDLILRRLTAPAADRPEALFPQSHVQILATVLRLDDRVPCHISTRRRHVPGECNRPVLVRFEALRESAPPPAVPGKLNFQNGSDAVAVLSRPRHMEAQSLLELQNPGTPGNHSRNVNLTAPLPQRRSLQDLAVPCRRRGQQRPGLGPCPSGHLSGGGRPRIRGPRKAPARCRGQGCQG